MHRIDTSGHSGNMFTDGNPGLGVEATVVDDNFMNALQEEIVNVILTKAGIALVKDTNTQLTTALELIYSNIGMDPGGRVTLSTGDAVPISAAGQTTVYYTPHRHNRVQLWDGTRWYWSDFAELSQATTDNTKSPAAVANNSNYDVFVWNDSGTMRATRGPAWSSATARGSGAGTTELEYFMGRWVNKNVITNGPVGRRGLYVGTIRSDGSAQINDTLAKRHVWNMFHRVVRPMAVTESTNSWSYLTATYRQANANAANQLAYVVGFNDDPVYARVFAIYDSATRGSVGIGLDSTTVNSALVFGAGIGGILEATYHGQGGLGSHILVWLENGGGAGAATWLGDDGGTIVQTGITGWLLA